LPKVMELEPRDPCFAHRRIERPQQIAHIPWVACPVEKDCFRAAGPFAALWDGRFQQAGRKGARGSRPHVSCEVALYKPLGGL
jgi:hypothetical protein